jgi:hypothetical protein
VHPLISTAELSARLGEEKLRIFDCTTFLHPLPEAGQFGVETGRKAYEEVGHIPGAALIDLQEDLSDNTSGLRFTALAPATLVGAFKAKGVGDDSDVVLYAGGDQWWASRVWPGETRQAPMLWLFRAHRPPGWPGAVVVGCQKMTAFPPEGCCLCPRDRFAPFANQLQGRCKSFSR